MSKNVFLIIENVRSLHNIGNMFRSAEGFGANTIILIGGSGYPPEPKISKAALGAEKIVNWLYFPTSESAITWVHAQGAQIVVSEITPTSTPIEHLSAKVALDRPIAIVVGSETDGVSQSWLEIAEICTHIPMKGVKESFNVAIAAAVMLYEVMRHRD